MSTLAPKILPIDDFARRFSMRWERLNWFLGAGASVAAGIPAAGDMIWEFKQQLYITQNQVSPGTVSDLSNPVVKSRLQSHVDSRGLPKPGSPEEYAALFETVYPAEGDRRSFIEARIRGGKPSYGHLAIATMMKAGGAKIIWTTNFDTLIADAAARVFGQTASLKTATLDAPDLAEQAFQGSRWPLEVKLHGDFRSRRLKNTNDELRTQDERLLRVLVDSCRTAGLVVAGYSGRDDSVMDALEKAIDAGKAFPGGLFWLARPGGRPLDRVLRFLERAEAAGCEAHLVEVQSFDEGLADLMRVLTAIDQSVLQQHAVTRGHVSPAPDPRGTTGNPIIRMNGIHVATYPVTCRHVDCTIGGYKEVLAAARVVSADMLIARVKSGVLAFGRDAEVRSAFSAYKITDFGFHAIERNRLRFDSGERGLLRDALVMAIKRSRNLEVQRRHGYDLVYPKDPDGAGWENLRALCGGAVAGSVSGSPGLTWSEGAEIRLDWASDQLWLLVSPRIVYTGVTNQNKAAASDFGRERTFKRYNRQLHAFISLWFSTLIGDEQEIRSLGISDGIDAVFKLSYGNCASDRITA